MVKKRRKERYIDRWLKNHPRVTFYLSKDEFDFVDKIARSKNMTVKDLVLGMLRGLKVEFEKAIEEGRKEGEKSAYMEFINHPRLFYDNVKRLRPKLEPMLFTAPCSICGRPMIFTHKDENEKERRTLNDAFRYWRHTRCRS
jgi:hypothetical protein